MPIYCLMYHYGKHGLLLLYSIWNLPNQLAMLSLTSDHLSDPTKIAWQRPWSLVIGFTVLKLLSSPKNVVCFPAMDGWMGVSQ